MRGPALLIGILLGDLLPLLGQGARTLGDLLRLQGEHRSKIDRSMCRF